MDDYSLNVFIRTCRTLNFAAAAYQLNLSPSAVSRQIKRLEDELGVPLFIRNNRFVRLSRHGELFLEFAEQRVRESDAFKKKISGMEIGLTGELKIFASVTACYTVLPSIVADFRHRYPGVHLKLVTGDSANALSAIEQNLADIAVAAMSENSSQFFFRKVLDTELVFIAPVIETPFSRNLNTRPFMFSEVPLVVPESGLSRVRLDRFFHENKIKPDIYAHVSGNEAITALVSLGCGVGFLPEIVAKSSTVSGGYRIMQNMPVLGSYNVGICCKDTLLDMEVVKAFVDCAGVESHSV
jgi:LysR family positive regulator for ilvC